MFCASPFVFVPQIACRDCGPLSHKNLGKRLCFHREEGGHEARSCARKLLINRCLRCPNAHWTRDCPAFVAKMKLDYERKRDSHWKFLLDSHDSIIQNDICADSDV